MSSCWKRRPQGSELSQAQLNNSSCLRALLCRHENLIGLFSSSCYPSSRFCISVLNIWTKNYVYFASSPTLNHSLELKKKQRHNSAQWNINCFIAQNWALVGKAIAGYPELHLQPYFQWPLLKTLQECLLSSYPASWLIYPHAVSCLSWGTLKNLSKLVCLVTDKLQNKRFGKDHFSLTVHRSYQALLKLTDTSVKRIVTHCPRLQASALLSLKPQCKKGFPFCFHWQFLHGSTFKVLCGDYWGSSQNRCSTNTTFLT